MRFIKVQKLKKYVYAHSNTIVDLMFVSILGLLSITWFRGDFLIATLDLSFPPNRILTFSRSLYLWDVLSLGYANARISALIVPYEGFRALSEIIGLSLVTTEKILFYGFFTFSGISMYYMTSNLINEGDWRRVARLVSALFYMMNPYIAVSFISLPFMLFYAFLPLRLSLYIKGLNESRSLRYIFLACLIWTTTTTSSYVNPALAVLDWALLLSYFTFFIALRRNDRRSIIHALQFTATAFFAWCALNMYWILPMTFFSQEEMEKAIAAFAVLGYSGDPYLILQQNSAPLLHVLRLTGIWTFRSGYKGDPYRPWASVYLSNIFLVMSIIIPLLAFMSLLLKPKNKHLTYFASLALIGLFLMNGSHIPFGEINMWLFTHTPLFQIFRQPFTKFGIIVTLSYAFLIGVGLSGLHYHFKKLGRAWKFGYLRRSIVCKLPVIFIVFLLSGVYAWPFWTGDVIYSGGNVIPSARVKVPEYYFEASAWLNTQNEDFRIFSLPLSKLAYCTYSWDHGYSAGDPTIYIFLPKPVIQGFGQQFPMYIAELVPKHSSTALAKMLALLNVKYLLFHNDANWKYLAGHPWYIPSISPDRFQSILSSQRGIYLEKTFGELDFYRNEYWRPIHIYAAPNALLVQGDLDEMTEVVGSPFTLDESVLFLSDQLTHEQYSFIANLSSYDLRPNITFKKINPTKYTVHVNASTPFFLVFSESYHKDWVAYTNGEQVPGERHFMANGYANAWFINKTGSYDIVLEFWPQKLFYTGSAISITTLILCILYISKNKINTIYKRCIKRNKTQTN